MYKEIETPAIAKKRYYFKKGYRQVTIAQKDEVITAILQKYGVTDIWDIVPENQKL